LIVGYAVYQSRADHQADALAMLRTEVSRRANVAFPRIGARSLPRDSAFPKTKQQVIARLMAVARDDAEAIMYRLQLASFLERHGQVDAAIGSSTSCG